MGFKNCKSCFVCDTEDLKNGIYLTTEKTSFTNTDFPTKIWELTGERFLVIVDPSDQLCNNCTLLINKSDKLGRRLVEIGTQITDYLSNKYNLDKEIDDECIIPSDVDTTIGDSGCKTPIIDDDDDDDDAKSEGILLDHIPQKGDTIDIQNDDVDVSSNGCKDKNESNVNIKEEPLNCNCEEECIEGNKQHECLNLSPSTCLVDFSSSDSISQGQAIKHDFFSEIEVQNFIGEDITEIKKEVHVHCTPDQSQTISPSEQISLTESSTPYLDYVSSDIVLNSLTTDTLNSKINENTSTLLVTKQEKNVFFEGAGSNLRIAIVTNDISNPKLVKPRQVVRRKQNRVYNGYQRKKLRPILPKLTNVLHSYCVLDLDATQENLIQSSSLNSVITTNNQPSYTNLNVNFSNNIDTEPIELNGIKSEVSQTETPDQLQCKVCSLSFDDLRSMRNHKKLHAKHIDAHECSICKRIYKTRSGLQNHQASHTGQYAFYCEVCGLGFMSRWALEEHSGCHTKESKYVCDICGKKFSYQSSYWIHKKWHENPFPYKCNECGRLFKHSSMLATHRRSKHSGERPYKCSFCSASFVVSNSLKRHEILHTKKYPFICETCQHGFTTRFRYTEHLAKAHSIIMDKAPVDNKDLKVVVNSEGAGVVTPDKSVVIDLRTTPELGLKDADDLMYSLPEEFSDNIVRIFGQYL